MEIGPTYLSPPPPIIKKHNECISIHTVIRKYSSRSKEGLFSEVILHLAQQRTSTDKN